jgi:adenine-specific DNA-methyltransferase
MICNEVFGKHNFEGHIHWRRRHNQPNDKTKMIGIVTEHILVYAKESAYLKQVGVGKLDLTATFTNADNDPKGPWASKPWKTGSDQNGSRYKIVTPTGKVLDEEWMGDEATYKKYLEEGRMYFPKGGDGMPRKKYYQFEREDEGQCATNWWTHEQFGHNQGANDCMTDLFGVKNVFSNPKPIELIRAIIKVANVKDGDVVVDFFSGSASTAHALMKLNSEGNGKRKFILIQIPEKCAEKTEAYKLGYENICQIGQERIRRAAKKIKEETNADIDYGFRVFSVDSTNMNDVYYSPAEYSQNLLAMLESNVKSDRTDLDLLFGCLLECGLPLSLPYSSEQIEACTVHNYNNGDLIACFDENVPDSVIKEIAKRQPLRAVFRDSSFANTPAKINMGEIFKMLAPDTRVKVI